MADQAYSSGPQTSKAPNLLQVGAEWVNTSAGGLNRYVEGLALGLSTHSVDQRWMIMGDDQIESSSFQVDVVAKPDASLFARWWAMRQAFTRQVEASCPDVITTHFALYALPIKKYLGQYPHVVHFHGPWSAESQAEGGRSLTVRAKYMLERAVYQTGDRYITLSEAFADVLCDRYGVDREKVRVIPGGVDVDRFHTGVSRADARTNLGWSSDRPTILCVRRLVHRMGLEQLIEAIASIKSKHPDVLLKIAGKGPLTPTLKQLIEKLDLSDQVELLGFVPDDDLPYIYSAADFTIVPSQSLEGFGLIIAESLAAGTPVLVTPVGGMPEAVRGLDSGLILRGYDVNHIADGLVAALNGMSMTGNALPTASQCQSYAREHYDWRVIAGRVLEVYREAAALSPHAVLHAS